MKREELILPSKYYGGFRGVFSPLTGGRISTVIPHFPLSQGCLIYRPMYHYGSVRVNISPVPVSSVVPFHSAEGTGMEGVRRAASEGFPLQAKVFRRVPIARVAVHPCFRFMDPTDRLLARRRDSATNAAEAPTRCVPPEPARRGLHHHPSTSEYPDGAPIADAA